jgi:transposase-like protein
MTMTVADVAFLDDRGVSPRSDLPKRRAFSAEYKARILAEYDGAGHGQRGAILRREGLFSSHVIDWRRSLAVGDKPTVGRDRRDREIDALRARAERAEAELARANAALEIVGKAHALLGLLSQSADTDKRSPQ